MRVLSRIFTSFFMAVILVFAGVSVSFADEKSDCLANGWMWDNDNKQCCWHYYVTDKDEILCINEANFGEYFSHLQCDYSEAALYIDSDGNPRCCPEGSIPNATTHQCRCRSGVLNTTTGQCEVFYLRSSIFCDLWNANLETGNIGYFFNYLNKDANSLATFQSKNTCSAVISKMKDIGLDDVVTGVPGTCDCRCTNPALTFNPDAADQCADGEVSECQNVCVDLTDNREPCPTGQQNYLINGEWQCCLFYDSSTMGCITSIQAWRTYVNEILNFESGGGYVNSEGLPVECPVKTAEGVAVNRETGRCICDAGGWFDTTTGTCINPITRRNHFGYNNNTQAMTSGISRIYKHYPQSMVTSNTVNSTQHGFFESFGRMVYNPNGQYVYTSIHPATTPANTEYVSTNPSAPGYLDAWPYVYLTLNGNGGTPSVQVKKYNLGMNASINQVNNATPTRDGYTFNGWWTSSTGGTQVDLAHLGINAVDTTYYAHWTGNSITLNWDENGGDTVTNGSCTYGGNLVLPAAPSRSGYTFNGWKLNNGTIKAAGSTVSGGCISTYTGVTSGTSTHIQAQWTQNAATNYTVTYNCGTGATGTAPASATVAAGSSFTAASNTCSKSGYVFIGWLVSGTTNDIFYPDWGRSWTYTQNKTLTAQWAKFSALVDVTSVNGTIEFNLGAIGTYTVNCGDGGTLSGTGVSGNTITRTSTTTSKYTCTYSRTGGKIIGFDGTSTGYGTFSYENGTGNTFDFVTRSAITQISGSLGAIFPTLTSVGNGTSLQPTFCAAFKGSNIASIPENLFSGISGTTVDWMFRDMFQHAMITTSLPDGLFSGITGNNGNRAFWGTFADVTYLTGYIPPSMFSGLVANGSPGSMYVPFRNNYSLAQSCPTGMTQYFTGYESYWDGYVSCASNKVTYSCGTGAGTPPVDSGVVNGLHFRVSANTCTKSGYSFAGWKVSGTSDIKAENTHFQWNYGATNKTFTAQWTQDTVTISYDANGGSGSMQLSTTCNSGESCALQTWNNDFPHPCNITNGNKIFLGWSTDPNATTATYTNSGTFTSDTLLYAVWATPTCSVTNGTGTITTPSNNAPRCVVTCNTGYSTSGTYTGTAGGTSVSYTCGVGQYLLTLTDNKNTSNTRSLFEIYGNRWASNTNGQPSGTSITTVPGMTRTGYKFRGYYTSDLDDVTSNTSSTTGFKMKTNLTTMDGCAGTNCTETLTSDTEWFAAWAQDCEITHGTCDVTIGTLGQVTYSASCNDGYTLSGGNTSRPTCTPISYTVTFGANGGSGAANPTSVTCVYDQDCTLAAKGTLAKTNTTFDGWNTATDGSGDGYLESDTVQNLTTTSGATIPLYAVWRTSGCSAGQYLEDGECVSCPAGYSCAGGDASPVICAVNKYSTGGAASCSSCTGGLTTSSVEDARYHDEAADCGRVLHVGVHEIRLKSIPATGALSSLVPSPSLRFNYAGNANGRPDFYANMSTIASPMRVSSTGQISTATSGNKFKTQYNNTNYYVCDDVTCVTE